MLQFEANIDDMNPEWFEIAVERLFAAGAVDVVLIPAQMKKNRPATLLQVIAPEDAREKIAATILRETTTLGVRYFPIQRRTLKREVATVTTEFGEVAVKIATDPELHIRKIIPEYDSCKKMALENNLPIERIYDAIRRSHRNHD